MQLISFQYFPCRRRYANIIFDFIILHSALATVLSDAKTSAECTVPDASASTMDDSVVMLALAIFIVSAPKEILLASDLQNKCIGVFTRCVRSSSIQVLAINVVGLSLRMELSLNIYEGRVLKRGSSCPIKIIQVSLIFL